MFADAGVTKEKKKLLLLSLDAKLMFEGFWTQRN